MKKTISLLLALAFMLSLAACGGNGAPAKNNQPDTSQPGEPEDVQAPAAPEENHYPVTITNYDYEGNPVEYTYEKAPEIGRAHV